MTGVEAALVVAISVVVSGAAVLHQQTCRARDQLTRARLAEEASGMKGDNDGQ